MRAKSGKYIYSRKTPGSLLQKVGERISKDERMKAAFWPLQQVLDSMIPLYTILANVGFM
jgi:hypothetical protein